MEIPYSESVNGKEGLPKMPDDLITSLGLIPHPEGGYFREMHRSGSKPMKTKGQTDVNVATNFANTETVPLIQFQERSHYESLTIAPGRERRRPDGDVRRNCLTSMLWMPTTASPRLYLSVNLSDDVHFYQGGGGFEYDPVRGELRQEVLGAKFDEGQKMQVVCPGGVWKCGRLLKSNEFDYCLIGEAVAPVFDFHDFSWVTKSQILSISNEDYRQILLRFLHDDIEHLSGNEVTDSATFYIDDEN